MILISIVCLFLFAGMLEYDPVKRFSIQRIRQHKWVHQCMWSAWFLTDRMLCWIQKTAEQVQCELVTTHAALRFISDYVQWSQQAAEGQWESFLNIVHIAVRVYSKRNLYAGSGASDAGALMLDESGQRMRFPWRRKSSWWACARMMFEIRMIYEDWSKKKRLNVDSRKLWISTIFSGIYFSEHLTPDLINVTLIISLLITLRDGNPS